MASASSCALASRVGGVHVTAARAGDAGLRLHQSWRVRRPSGRPPGREKDGVRDAAQVIGN